MEKLDEFLVLFDGRVNDVAQIRTDVLSFREDKHRSESVPGTDVKKPKSKAFSQHHYVVYLAERVDLWVHCIGSKPEVQQVYPDGTPSVKSGPRFFHRARVVRPLSPAGGHKYHNSATRTSAGPRSRPLSATSRESRLLNR